MRSAVDVVVIGGGIVGASIGYQLALRGASVTVLDKGAGPAEGSTGASSSICRSRYTYPELVRLAFHGQEIYGNWQEFTRLAEVRSSLHRVGVLWMMGEPEEKVRTDTEKLVSQGVAAEAIDASQVEDLFPALNTCVAPFDWSGETEHVCAPGDAYLFEPEGGYADPVGANQDLIEATRVLGEEAVFRSEVVGFLRSGNGITGVKLADGTSVASDLVINAAGPWCNPLNEEAGAELRWHLTPTRIQTVYREWPADLGALPVGADATGIYFRPESAGQQILVGSTTAEDEEEVVDDPDNYKQVPDAEFIQMKMAAFHHRIPELEARGVPAGIAGLYTVNREDSHPILGETGVDGFWVANGFSGHGFKLAPAIGAMVAQAYTGSASEHDIDVPFDFFSVDREPIELEVKSVLA